LERVGGEDNRNHNQQQKGWNPQMTVVTRTLHIKTKANIGIHDITIQVQDILEKTELLNGVMILFCPGSTGALSTIEYEPGLVQDLPNALERIAPRGGAYSHHQTWGDDNGSGHVRAALIGPSLTVPFVRRMLTLGRWQQIVFIECDTRDRERRLVVQVIGE
jgi:secondary thiamine-phosphate synthase enzyme